MLPTSACRGFKLLSVAAALCLALIGFFISNKIVNLIDVPSISPLALQQDECIKILRYDIHPDQSAGLDHLTDHFKFQVWDAAIHGYTLIMVDTFDGQLTTKHLRDNDTESLNMSFWFYYDVDRFAKEQNIVIMEYSKNWIERLKLELNISTNQLRIRYTQGPDGDNRRFIGDVCEQYEPECNTITVRQGTGAWWIFPKCYADSHAVSQFGVAQKVHAHCLLLGIKMEFDW